ncbi:MAG: BC10 family protein [Chloroflexi bacterium]|nr:BC10 family protein [Chloroflexota bacterium]
MIVISTPKSPVSVRNCKDSLNRALNSNHQYNLYLYTSLTITDKRPCIYFSSLFLCGHSCIV